MLSACLFVSIGVFLSYFFDIARYACEKSNENTFNIKQNTDRILMTDLGLNDYWGLS